MKNFCKPIDSQSGIVLISSLIFILAITIIGFSGMNISTVQQKMAANMRSKEMAFQAAEAALLKAEQYLSDTASLPAFTDSLGLYNKTSNGLQLWKSVDWADAAKVVKYTQGFQELHEKPAYIIEKIDHGGTVALSNRATNNYQYFRITARAKGNSSSALVVLQSIYRR